MTAYASENERRHHALEVADQPVFLVASERSGTTMLPLMLDGHPSMSFGEEFEFAVEHLTETGVRPDLDWYHRELADKVAQRSPYRPAQRDSQRIHHTVATSGTVVQSEKSPSTEMWAKREGAGGGSANT